MVKAKVLIRPKDGILDPRARRSSGHCRRSASTASRTCGSGAWSSSRRRTRSARRAVREAARQPADRGLRDRAARRRRVMRLGRPPVPGLLRRAGRAARLLRWSARRGCSGTRSATSMGSTWSSSPAGSPTATTCAPARSPASRRRWSGRRLAAAGGPVLGICNGFQVLCEAGLLPGALLRTRRSASSAARSTSSWRRGRAVHRRIEPATGSRSRSSTSRPLLRAGRRARRAGGERARSSSATRPATTPTARCATSPASRNEAGNVVGLMPHPEHAVDPLTGSRTACGVFEGLWPGSPEVSDGRRPKYRELGTDRLRVRADRRAARLASPTTSSWRCSACSGPSTAPTSTRASCCAGCRPRASGW